MRHPRKPLVLFPMALLAVAGAAHLDAAPPASTTPLPTGSIITPVGTHVGVGSFPVNMAISPDGRYVVVTNVGSRQYLSVLDAHTGRLVSQLDFNKPRANKSGTTALYVGLAFAPARPGQDPVLYAARGTEDIVSAYTLSQDGTLTDTGKTLKDAPESGGSPLSPAGLGVSADGATVYAANNEVTSGNDPKSSMAILDAATGERRALVDVPGYPLAVAVCTSGPAAHRKVYVSSERDGVVADVDPQGATVRRTIPTGSHPMSLLLDKAQRRLFVANAGSDTVSIVSTGNDKVTGTILLRPAGARGLPGATPSGLALSADEKRLYVTLADMNAVAVVDLAGKSPQLLGYIPTGWYPTSVLVAPDGKNLFVSCARGVAPRNPNGAPQGPDGKWGQYIMNVIEGTVSRFPIPTAPTLRAQTARVLTNNRVAEIQGASDPVAGVPIKHVIYIIKENRTYDQVLGDMPKGNGDASLTLFGAKVTPNQHALADRFVLLDNFYCSAEVSGSGWNWSTSGMANEYTQRTVAYNYAGRGRTYDWEGTNNGTAVDLLDIPDVATAPGGYIWDNAARHGLTYRNYGFFVGRGPRTPQGEEKADPNNLALQKVLEGHTDVDFRQFDMSYADSDAWVKINAPDTVTTKTYGRYQSPSRFAEWKREFDEQVRTGTMPQFTMIRLPRDHTAGTTPGQASPSAMAADNDYGVGQIVEAVSHSPFWKDSAIFIVEDDAQNGFDHVDCHRSTAYVISPYVRPNTVDSRFYNTDSVLHTMEALLGLPPMNRYDAQAPVLDIWSKTPVNAEPYTAVLPDESILRQVSQKTAYRAEDSKHLPFHLADAVPEDVLNDILWHAIRGVNTPAPPIRNGAIQLTGRDSDD